MGGAALVSVSSAFPENSVATGDIEARLGLDVGWLVRRTGVRWRRRASPDERLSDLCAAAAQRALDQVGSDAADVDMLIVATMTPQPQGATVAPLVASTMGVSGAAVDIGAACSGFLSSLVLATGAIEAGQAEQVVVVGGDLMSRVLDDDDRVTAGIFGDGAGAVVMRAVDGPSMIGPAVLGSDGADGDAIVVPRPTGPIRMDGHRTFRRAVDTLVKISREATARAGLSLDDIDLFVPHQANRRITTAVAGRLGLPGDRVVDCIAHYGNTTAATLPTALAYAQAQGRLETGARILLASFGAGLTWGAVVARWGVT